MSVTRTLEIQRLLSLDESTMLILRNFDVDWNCGTRFLLTMIKAGRSGAEVSQALSDVLFDYKILCQQGISDYERLFYVLSQLFQKLKDRGLPVPQEQVEELCKIACIPGPIQEQLLNG